MMIPYGNSERLTISEKVDKDNELEANISCNGVEDATVWLSKEDAVRLIKHLRTAFGI